MGQAMGGGGVVHKYKSVTFSNVKWEKFDHIPFHPDGSRFHEPSVHIIANEKNIEFHGYNISEMDEGVIHTIRAEDDFEISCHVDTSTIQPHPGGCVTISLGIISANLDQNGGEFFLDGKSVARVGSRFHLRMSLTQGRHYEIAVDNKRVGQKDKSVSGKVNIEFSFAHESHCCELLSHAYISNIQMMQTDHDGDDSAETPTWDN